MTTNTDIVRAHYAASAQGNIDKMMAHVSAQVRWTEMAGFPCAGRWVGPQAVVDNVFTVETSDRTIKQLKDHDLAPSTTTTT